MPSNKRDFTSMNQQDAVPKRQSPFIPMFEHFRDELDEHHDRRERIIKSSRDVTAASKKIIFTLQRIRKIGMPLPEHVHKSNNQYYDTIKLQITNVVPDIQGQNYYRYNRQFTGGLQEYMEAALFQHYLETGSLMSYEDAAKLVQQLSTVDHDGQAPVSISLTMEDYLLGLFDMTGELMRFAITAMATTGSLPTTHSSNVLNDLRGIRAALERLELGYGPFAKEVEKKMEVMQTSVEKVEKSLYGLTVRGSERPKGWMPTLSSTEIET